MSMWWNLCQKLVKRNFKLAFMVPKKPRTWRTRCIGSWNARTQKSVRTIPVLSGQGTVPRSFRITSKVQNYLLLLIISNIRRYNFGGKIWTVQYLGTDPKSSDTNSVVYIKLSSTLHGLIYSGVNLKILIFPPNFRKIIDKVLTIFYNFSVSIDRWWSSLIHIYWIKPRKKNNWTLLCM